MLEAMNHISGAVAALKIGDNGLIRASDFSRIITSDSAFDQMANFARRIMTGTAQIDMHNAARLTMQNFAAIDMSGGRFLMTGGELEMHAAASILMAEAARMQMDANSILRIVNGALIHKTEQSISAHRGFDPNRNQSADASGNFSRRGTMHPTSNGAFSNLLDNSVFIMAGMLDDFANDPNYPEHALGAALALFDSSRARIGVLNTGRILITDSADLSLHNDSRIHCGSGTFQLTGTSPGGHLTRLFMESSSASTNIEFLAGTQINLRDSSMYARNGLFFIGTGMATGEPVPDPSTGLRRVITEADVMAFATILDETFPVIGQPQLVATRGTAQETKTISQRFREYCDGVFSASDYEKMYADIRQSEIDRQKRDAEEKAERERKHAEAIKAQAEFAKLMQKQNEERLAKMEADNELRQTLRMKEHEIYATFLNRLLLAENKFHLAATVEAQMELETLLAARKDEQEEFRKLAETAFADPAPALAKIDALLADSVKCAEIEQAQHKNFLDEWRTKAEKVRAAEATKAQERSEKNGHD